ncbi:MAG: hypothetical protein JST40_07985 [Armatimonadetes bacterium]|nr:hypothetical protein [Armatimonadota bacterium]
MNNNLYNKLVDLYAGDELPEELTEELVGESFKNTDLRHDMVSLKETVNILRTDPGAEFTDETFNRILMRMYTKGLEVKTRTPEPDHLQLKLPLSG